MKRSKITEREFTSGILVKLLHTTNALLRSIELSTDRLPRARSIRRTSVLQAPTGCLHKISYQDQVIESVGESEHPSPMFSSFVPCLAYEPDGLPLDEHPLASFSSPRERFP